MTTVADEAKGAPGRPALKSRYVLLTQCLQNDFFLNRECRIYLGDQSSKAMLIGPTRPWSVPGTTGQVQVAASELRTGPLACFFEASIGRRRRGEDGLSTLHVINIRDWHEPGVSYDLERRSYGSHCERGTWGAGYIDGLQRYLDPACGSVATEARSYVEGSVRICHVHSDSVFDFRPRLGADGTVEGKLPATELENILDILVQGSDDEVGFLDRLLSTNVTLRDAGIAEMAESVRDRETSGGPVYMAVIGAYSDVKILTLLGGLLSRYDLPNIALSDSLSASPTLERHISGLDFANKVMHVEVLHGINDLVRYLGGTPSLTDESAIIGLDGFAQFQTFFKDKQSVLAYESEKLRDYLQLTEERSVETYRWIKRANIFLLVWGSVFLVATLVLAILSAVDPNQVSWVLPAVTGGLGLLQLVSAFFTRPTQDLYRNLLNLTTYRMVLESHSLKLALARFHLTTPHTLREIRTPEEEKQARRQISLLERELAAIQKSDAVDYGALQALGFGSVEGMRGMDGDEPARPTSPE